MQIKDFTAAGKEQPTLTLKLGPAEVGRFEHVFRRVFYGRDSCRGHIESGGAGLRAVVQDAEGDVVALTAPDSVNLNALTADMLAVACARTGKHKLSDRHIIAGLVCMGRFFSPPHKVSLLDAATKHFDQGASGDHRYEARLLALCAMQLAQRTPEITRRATELFGHSTSIKKRFRQIVNYQLALASFHTYEDKGYSSALDYLSKIPKPRLDCEIDAWLGRRGAQRALLLYLLAQAQRAVILAHRKPHDAAGVEASRAEFSEVVAKVERLADHWAYRRLGHSLGEVRWRLYSAKAAFAYIRHESSPDAVADGKAATQIAPYALAAKSNLATLLVLEAEKVTDASERERKLRQPLALFRQLEETGWDPGYVHYRLLHITRVLGDFAEAERHAQVALNPEHRDVHIPHSIAKSNY